ncbi:MAG: trypsin-like peptidase domain-containing protein [Deltaproteobacteria bacterium]|nr:MAG: trypsin-like peptidase domain-containing protein [Deltaproteobacteria bacterium]
MKAVVTGLVLCSALPAGSAGAGDPFLRRTAAVEAVQKVGPSVVNITTEQTVTSQNPFRSFLGADPLFERFFEDFFEPRASRRTQSLGSGVLIDADRHVLTNEHVIAHAQRIRVLLADDREFEARLVGADPNNDLAVLRVETDEALPWTPPARSGDLLVGEPVIAIGNPFGLANTVTTGVISALDRSIRHENRVFHGFLQTDASINPGNSGGPLLNAEGDLIGINTAIYAGADGIGFAIPIDVAKRIVRELIAHGEVSPVWLGLELQDIDPRMHDVMELPRGLRGALVSGVQQDGPAGRGGLRQGDIVVRFDGHDLRTAREFYDLLDRCVVGQEVGLEVWREGGSARLSASAEGVPDGFVGDLAARLLGLELMPHPAGGYAIHAVRSASGSDKVGIRRGDLLLQINGRTLADGNQLRRSILDLRGRTRAHLLVQRGRGRYPVMIPLG